MINLRYIFYLIFLTLVIIIIINWNNLVKIYNYKIYKENCIVSNLSYFTKNSIYKDNEFNRNQVDDFCNCKVESFRNDGVEIFISKLSVQEKFVDKDTWAKDNSALLALVSALDLIDMKSLRLLVLSQVANYFWVVEFGGVDDTKGPDD